VVLAARDNHDRLAEAQEAAAVTSRVLGDAEDDTTEAVKRNTEAIERNRERMLARRDAQVGTLGAQLDWEQAIINSQNALDDYTDTLNDTEASERDRAAAGIDLMQAYIDEAEAAGANAENTAIAAGRGATAQQENVAVQITELTRLAQTVAPDSYLRRQIDGYINDLKRIPTSVGTTIEQTYRSTGGGNVQRRASGGPVSSGQPYLVGEEGPELIVPGSSGTVIPNGASVGGGVQVIINGAGLDAALLAWLRRAVRVESGGDAQAFFGG
jgi:hypothetical protein